MFLFGLLRYFLPVAVAPAPVVFRFNPPPLFVCPVLVPRRRRCLPFPLQVRSRLFPPPHPHRFLPLPLHYLAQVQNMSRCNILRDCILISTNSVFRWLKTPLLSLRLRRGVLPPSI